MKIEAYLRILSDEATIRAIHVATNVLGARIKQTKAPRSSRNDTWWDWETERVPIQVDNEDDGLRALLQQHRPCFPVIRKYCAPETDIYLEVITTYETNEDPQGLYLSAETILLLSELGAALDHDVYR